MSRFSKDEILAREIAVARPEIPAPAIMTRRDSGISSKFSAVRILNDRIEADRKL